MVTSAEPVVHCSLITQLYRQNLTHKHCFLSACNFQLMYELPPGNQYKRGYKAPRDIANVRALDSIAEYWPNAKLIVGLRHPGE